jgi:hypothetical protein
VTFNRFPTYQEPVVTKNVTTRGWYSFWAALFTGTPTGPVAPIKVGSSPFTYPAPVGGAVIVQGGTTTQIQYSRDGNNFFVTGVTAGMLPVSQGDQLVITYSVGPPTLVFVPK